MSHLVLADDSGDVLLETGDALLLEAEESTPSAVTNYNSQTPCVVGLQWFPTLRSSHVLASDLDTIAMVLTASDTANIAQVWPFISSVDGQSCVSLEIFDVTAGDPTLDPLTQTTYYPSSDLYVTPAVYPSLPPPFDGVTQAVGAYGPMFGYDVVAGKDGPFWQVLDSVALTPWVWTNSGAPVANDEFIFNFFGRGFDIAEQFASVAGSQAGNWVTRVRSRAVCAQYLDLGATGAIQVTPYLWVNGIKYTPGGPSGNGAQSISASQGPVEVVYDWFADPSTGLPWTSDAIDRFDTSIVGDERTGFGWIVNPTGSSNNLATILQAQLIVESAPTDPRIGIASLCADVNGGWQQFEVRDPATGNVSPVPFVAGNDYLFLFRRSAGTGRLGFAFMDSTTALPGPPLWTSETVKLDPVTHRPTQFGSLLTPAYAVALVKDDTDPSVDSQPYMTRSRVNAIDAFPLLNEYFDNSPVNVDRSMQQEFTPTANGDYEWLSVQLAMVGPQTDGDLSIVIRDQASDTAQAAAVVITFEDLSVPRQSWQTIGARIPIAPASLTSGTQYYFDVTSTAAADQGWLVQVLETGNEPPPAGPPTGTFVATFGAGINGLTIGDPPTEYQTKTACINIAESPDTPTGFDAINSGESCCIEYVTLLWDEATFIECGGFLAYELQRRNPDGDWQRIAYITDRAVTFFDDWEAPFNLEVEYRMRVFQVYGPSPSDWTETVTATSVTSCCGLLLTSNVSPDLSVFYPDVYTGDPVRDFTFLENRQVFQPQDRNFQVVYRELEDRGVQFAPTLRVRADHLPCGPGCANPATGAGIKVFDPLKAICRAGLPYVCVKNESGDVWYTAITTPTGHWQQTGREIDGPVAVYTMDVEIIEVTDTPYAPDSGTGS